MCEQNEPKEFTIPYKKCPLCSTYPVRLPDGLGHSCHYLDKGIHFENEVKWNDWVEFNKDKR